MKLAALVFGLLLSTASLAKDVASLPEEKIKSLVGSVTEASNRMMMNGSKVEDIDAIFAMYTDDFVYVHEVYGGTYTRELLYGNSVRNLKAGRYQLAEPRYQLVSVIPGLNAAAVVRRETKTGKNHLAVFEFKGEKISKITEYWK